MEHGAAERSPSDAVARYVHALRLRAGALQLTRALAIGGGVASLGIVGLAALTGPVLAPWLAYGLLGVLGLGVAAATAQELRPLLALRGLGSCGLIAQRSPALAFRVRSTLELRDAPIGSPALVAAHAASIRDALQALPAREVVPVRPLRQRSVALSLLAALLSAALLYGNASLRDGARTLLHPATLRADGVRVAKVIGSVSAKLVFPSYLALPPRVLQDPSVIGAPRGTTVELVITPRLSSQRGTLLLDRTVTAIKAAPAGRLVARFVVRDDATLSLRLWSDGTWYEDSASRSVRLQPDRAPVVAVTAPADTHVDVTERVALPFHAQDDHGLAAIDLVVRLENGPEQRMRLWSTLSADKPERSVVQDATLSPAEVGAAPGDVLVAWIEARDGDVVSGPNIGESRAISFEVATDAHELSRELPQLREVLDAALTALADRLETKLPGDEAQAELRFGELRDVTESWLTRLQQLIANGRGRDRTRGLDLDPLQAMLERARKELTREASVYRSGPHTEKARSDADTKMTAELERDALLLSDLLAQGLVDEARSLTQELADLKQHMRELLAEFKKTKSAEARRALLAEIAKAQRRLRELAESLSRLSNRVPSEFINREALPQNDAGDALSSLHKAIEDGNLDEAEKQLDALSQEIDELADHIEKGGARFREAHFGPQDKAMAEVRRQVSALAGEQSRLSDRSHDVVKRAADRAKAQSGAHSANSDLQRAADDLVRDLDSLANEGQNAPEGPWLDRARARMRDAADALRTGDMAEARGMSSAASTNLEQAAAGLEQEAHMMQAHGERAAAQASAANAASERLRRLQRQIDQSTPRLSQFIGEPERDQLRGDLDSQQQARKQADTLRDKMAHGPDGTPLSQDGERGLEAASEAMRRAEQALERGDPQGSALAQQDASERLHQLEEQLARKGRSSPRDGNGQHGGKREGNSGDPRTDEPVRIPTADEFKGPVETRRKLLDAMREAPPRDYKSAVTRYYEELLR